MIFISYRIQDSNDLVDRLATNLMEEFGTDLVFRDKSRLIGGQDWTVEIERQARTCRVMLVAIGGIWQSVQCQSGEFAHCPRLLDPEDWVRREITLALEQGKIVIPVLLNNTAMPPAAWLGIVGLRNLHAKQAVPLRTDEYSNDLSRLIATIRVQCPAPPTDSKTTPAPIPRDYLDRLRDSCADVGLLGLKLRQGQSVKLNHVYVPLTTQTLEHGERRKREIPVPSEEERRKPPQLLLKLLDSESLYVAGAAGSGKSTFCRWVAWLACTGSLPETPVPAPKGYADELPGSFVGRLPLLVRLRDFWQYLPLHPGVAQISQQELEDSLLRWANATRPAGIDGAIVGPHLASGSLLLLLDGLDEVPLSHGSATNPCQPRAMLLEGLIAAVKPWTARGHRVLLTSRNYGVGSEQATRLGLRPAPLAELDEPLRKLLVRRWFHCLIDNPSRAAETAEQMLRHVALRDDLSALIANPMLLTAICIVYSEGGRLPQDRHDVYDRIVDNVLFNRFPQERTVIESVRNRLAVVAYGMHTGEGLGETRATPQAQATWAEVDKMIQAYQDKTSWTEEGFTGAVAAREQLLTHTGLLLPQGDQRAGFYHLTIQDYLAAQRLLDVCEERLVEVFRERGSAPEWRSTLSFVFGSQLAKRSSPERSIALLGELVDELSPQTLGVSLVVADCLQILLKRGLRLKGELEEKFRRYCVAAIAREVPLRARYDLAATLGYVGDPRIVTDLRDRAAYVEIPAGMYRVGDDELRVEMEKQWGSKDHALPQSEFEVRTSFWLSKYPVTNAQYELFLVAGGYKQREWWSAEGWNWREEHGVIAPEYWHDGKWNLPNQPVVGVSFYEAEAFAKWAGGRLPSDREWEAAARGRLALDYPWGGRDQWENGICNSREAGLGVTSPVGIFPRSRSADFGLEDMAGNVWEWCADLWSSGGSFRVNRGGSWAFAACDCRSAIRSRDSPEYRIYDLGFRLLLSS
ncbi:MAG: SUMF1/EgtB/PvdO family nonheme iron enzyme, partial [Planctomycetota bacterium]|nr:SUMF1/EgtB/PvdO family nonheme iron enzyme [Planctomycetota bacterium]